MKRRRLKQSMPFEERLAAFAQQAREEAAELPAGAEREDMLRKASQAETAASLNDWINSPGLQSPK